MSEERLDLKVVRTGREYSGLPKSQILQWMREKRVIGDDLVKPHGARNWMKVSMAPELLSPDAAAKPREKTAAWKTEPASEPSTEPIDSGTYDLGIEAPARARPRRRLRVLEDSVLDMTPMIDVTFQMLIFFMFTNQLANPVPIAAPEAVYGKGVLSDGKQVVLIDQEGRYYLGESAREESAEPSLDSAIQKITENASVSESPLEVIITAHKESKHAGTRELMQRLSEVGNIGQIRLGVEEKQ
jgi:biopolymer transport protein ExbD